MAVLPAGWQILVAGRLKAASPTERMLLSGSCAQAVQCMENSHFVMNDEIQTQAVRPGGAATVLPANALLGSQALLFTIVT